MDKKQHLFILGVERSGSTWLSNILDAHEDTEFFMEPFADYAGIFGDLSKSRMPFDNFSNAHMQISEGYKSLEKIKYPFFSSRTSQYSIRKLDNFILKITRKINANLELLYLRNELLNLNYFSNPYSMRLKKNNSISLYITKEFRLNLRVKDILLALENPKIIIIIRDPVLQIGSILKLTKLGYLKELKRHIDKFKISINCHSFDIKNIYQYDFGESSKYPDSFHYFLWWLVCYDRLIKDCRRHGIEYMVMSHEYLSTRPKESIKEICRFSGLSYSTSMDEYIKYSTKDIPVDEKINNIINPLDTLRKNYVCAQIDDNQEMIISDFYKFLDGVSMKNLDPFLSRYIT